jgi:hypothetical protein
VDALERALKGVQTSEEPDRGVSVDHNSGLVGIRSVVQIDVVDDSPEEREVIVNLSPEVRRKRRS